MRSRIPSIERPMPPVRTMYSMFHRRLTTIVAIAVVASNGPSPAVAQACHEHAMIVFDASSSMASLRSGRSRIDLAREALGELLPEVTKHRPTGLVTFGGRGPPCADVTLRVPPAIGTGQQIMSALRKISPRGATEIESSVDLATRILQQKNVPGIVVLLTDGIELCGRDVCNLADRLQKERVRVHVIGFQLRGQAIDTLTCLADATGGTYAQAMSLDGLRQALRSTLSCARLSQATQMSFPRHRASTRSMNTSGISLR